MTNRRLVLIRHAKAVHSAPTHSIFANPAAGDPAAGDSAGGDSARPLAARGERDAVEAGRWLAEYGVRPDRVVVSPARRTRQTWDLAARRLAPGTEALPAPQFDDRMYDNTAADLLEIVRETPAEAGTLVLVGHYPSVPDLALLLDDSRAGAASEIADKYPTSGIAVLDLHTDWAGADTGTATLQAFGVPRGE